MAEKFEYKYSAPTKEERKEIDSILSQYVPKDEKENKMDRLRYLDNKVKTIPTIWALSIGLIGILIFGLGLTCILEWNSITIGIVLMVIGSIIMIPAYFIHNLVKDKLKAKYSKEIISLSEELLNQEKNEN